MKTKNVFRALGVSRLFKEGDLIKSSSSPSYVNLVIKVEPQWFNRYHVHSVRYARVQNGVKRILDGPFRIRPFEIRERNKWTGGYGNWYIVGEVIESVVDNTTSIELFREQVLKQEDLYWNKNSGQAHDETGDERDE
jgi:hypothetical protein